MKSTSTLSGSPLSSPEFLNARDLVLGRFDDKNLRHGQVFFANDSMFTETFYSEPVTNYLVGFRDPNDLDATLQFIAPRVPVPGRLFEFKQATNAEEFVSEVVDDQRALGSDFKHVKYSGTDQTAKTINRGLTYVQDLDKITSPNWQNEKAAKLLRRLRRNSIRRAVAALYASAVSVPYTWDKSEGVNPDGDVKTELVNATNQSGMRPNRVLYGDTAFLYRDLSFGAQNNPAGYLGYSANPMESLASALQVDGVLVSRERYQATGSTKNEIVGNEVFCYYAEDDVDTEDPSHIKRFVSQFNAEQGGGDFRVYVQQMNNKLVAITVEHYELIMVPYADGIRALTITGPS